LKCKLCVLCLDGLVPDMIDESFENLHLKHVGLSHPPSASSLRAWRAFAMNKSRLPWWSDLSVGIVGLPGTTDRHIDNGWFEPLETESVGGLLFDNFPTENAVKREAANALAAMEGDCTHLSATTIQRWTDDPTEVVIAYLVASDRMGHVHRDWHPEALERTYRRCDEMADELWSALKPEKRIVLSDHGMTMLVPSHGWTPISLSGQNTWYKRYRDGYVVQSGHHWRKLPGYLSADFDALKGDQHLRKIGPILRQVI